MAPKRTPARDTAYEAPTTRSQRAQQVQQASSHLYTMHTDSQSTATPSVSSAANPLPAPTLTPRTTPSPQLVNQPVHDVRVQTADAKSTTRRSLLSWLILLAFGCVVGLYVIWLWPPARLVHLVCEAVLKWLGCWSEDSHHAGFVARVVQEGVDPDLPIAWHRNI